MARKKVKLAWIANDASRRATFKKRKRGLIKKVSELSTLCGVEAMAIVMSPYDSHPEVWPSVHDVQRTLLKFKNLPELDQGKKMLNQEGFFRHKIEKLKEQLKRAMNDASELLVDQRMNQFFSGKKDAIDDLSMRDMNELSRKIDVKSKMISERLEVLRGWAPDKAVVQQGPALSTTDWLTGGKGAHSEKMYFEGAMGALQRQQWFMEVMNPPQEHQHICHGCSGPEVGATYPDHHVNPWFDAFLPPNLNGM